MAEIILSSAIRSSLDALRVNAKLIATAQTRLATGRKVNTALDNPLLFFMAAEFSRRAAELDKVADDIGTASQTLQAANDSITALTTLINSAQSVANSAIASVRTTSATTGTVAGLTTASSFAVANGNTITVGDGTTTATITSTGTLTVQQIIDGVNNTSNLKVRASLSSDGRILLEATQTNTITVGGTASAPEKAQFGLVNGTSVAGTLNSSRSSLAVQFDQLRTQVSQLAADAGFNNVNLLKGGTLKVDFNETGTSSMSITGVTFDAAGLGIDASLNTWQTDKDIQDAINDLSAALKTVENQSTVFSSNVSLVGAREAFTTSMVATLNSASEDLVNADTNEEGAALLALQTRQELAATALSLAAQADASVLRLFR